MMNEINWKQKLTSRKFWAALIGFITALLVAFGVDGLTIEQVVAIVSAASTLIAYIIGEGLVDAARVKQESSGDNVVVLTDEGLKAIIDEQNNANNLLEKDLDLQEE